MGGIWTTWGPRCNILRKMASDLDTIKQANTTQKIMDVSCFHLQKLMLESQSDQIRFYNSVVRISKSPPHNLQAWGFPGN